MHEISFFYKNKILSFLAVYELKKIAYKEENNAALL
jgi:hypothetical protein